MALPSWVQKKRIKGKFVENGFAQCVNCTAGARLLEGDSSVPTMISCGDALGAGKDKFLFTCKESKILCPRLRKSWQERREYEVSHGARLQR